MRPFLPLLCLGLTVTLSAAEPALQFSSGPTQTALLELYTSEGCSSCPPAERWLGELRRDSGLWRDFVPVAFHVNYWDRLGWRDEFANREFTAREYAYSRAWSSDSVYTPCFVRNGREWRPTRDGGTKATDTGVLTVGREARNRWSIRFVPVAKPSAAPEVTLALLGGGIRSAVRAGENSGRTLEHEFVVLALRRSALTAAGDGGFTATLELDDARAAKLPRPALAAWVSAAGELAPLQATGGWLPRE